MQLSQGELRFKSARCCSVRKEFSCRNATALRLVAARFHRAKIGGWKFIQCGTVEKNPRCVTFAELPPIPTIFIPEGYWLPWPVEGDEFHVTDCATQSNFAGTVTGGGL